MARQTKLIEIKAEDGAKAGRDEGKKYLITEMSAEQAEWWAFRALQGVALAEFDFGDMFARDESGNLQTPLADLAAKGIKAVMGIDPQKAKPLFDEMMQCVSIPIAGGAERDMLPSDIEEISTRIRLRKEILAMHIGFFTNGDE